jgi:hypothetical protein
MRVYLDDVKRPNKKLSHTAKRVNRECGIESAIGVGSGALMLHLREIMLQANKAVTTKMTADMTVTRICEAICAGSSFLKLTIKPTTMLGNQSKQNDGTKRIKALIKASPEYSCGP